ncbi:MAG TPA: sigma-70 family RNA polymerase sigma factor, partial [Bryobacteraceae bacterium]|nr:sigma-70 family RNA polymerase sigma factor [Bryobacteraceae bacterium]
SGAPIRVTVEDRRFPAYFAGLYAGSCGEKYGLSFQDFAAILEEVAMQYLPPSATPAEAAEFHQSLRLEELALARGCANGDEVAWECFLNRYRQKLYDAAGAIAREESIARELADSLYTDLFGTRQSEDGRRISKLASYTGRGSLEGWLRTVLAQEYINRYRSQRRLVSFDEKVQAGPQCEASTEVPADPRLEPAVDTALADLAAEERLILASYYLDGRTLAEIARMLGVHESTISRRIERITASLRKRIVRSLRESGMDARAAEEALDADVRDLTLDVRARLQEKKG